MKKLISLSFLSFLLIAGSCVSKKKYLELEDQYNNTRSPLSKTQLERDEYKTKYERIEERVAGYNARIQSLSDTNDSRLQQVEGVVISENDKKKMRKALENVNPEELAQAKTLQDSMNLIISYNLKSNLDQNLVAEGEEDDIDVVIDETVVMITISDKLLFRSGSAVVNPKANNLLERLANVINCEPPLHVMVEGPTDSHTVNL